MSADTAPQVLKALGHHELLLLLLQLSVLLAVSRALGELMRKLGQPPVIGELAAGVCLGPTVLGSLLPDLQHKLFPMNQAQADLLSVVAWLGVIFLLVVTGLETDLDLIKRKGRTALLVSLGGIVVPFLSGFGLGWLLPSTFLPDESQRLVFSLFIAVAMSISAVPVIAKVLMDLKLIRRDIGQLTLAAGMTDDTIGWILLSVVASLATRGEVDAVTVGRSVFVAVVFIALGLTIGRAVVGRVLAFIDTHVGGTSIQFSVIIAMALAVAAFTHDMGIEAVLGAFVVGILVGQAPRLHREVGHTLETVTAGFLAPIFFASAGLKVDLIRLFQPEVLKVGAVVLGIACLGKFVGVYIGAWAGKLPHWERLALGSGMNARGAMEIVVATVGLSLGVLTLEMYSIIVMVAIVTSLMAPPLLRWALSHVQIGSEEAERLERERISEQSYLHAIKRVLLVASNAPTTRLAARLCALAAKGRPIEISVLGARAKDTMAFVRRLDVLDVMRFDDGKSENVEEALPVLKELAGGSGGTVELRKRTGRSVSDIVLREAAEGFSLIVMGTRPRRGFDVGTALFGVSVDPVIQKAKCATLVVESARGQALTERLAGGEPIRRILVPTSGAEYSKHALEIACGIASACDATIVLLHVVRRDAETYLLDRQQRSVATELAMEMVHVQAEFGRKLGARIETLVIEGEAPEDEILSVAQREKIDVLVAGSQLRPMSERAFFGHRLDELILRSPCPVAVLTS